MPSWPLLVAACSSPDRPEPAPEPVAAARPAPAPGSRPGSWRPRVPVRARFEAGEVVLSAPWAGAPEVGLSLVGWGADGELRPAAPSDPALVGSRRTYDHGGLVEWWERGPAGLQQGFVVEAPPAGRLVVELALRGARAEVDADGRSATILPSPGGRIRYEGLASWDAEGADLPAWMEEVDGGLRLVVDAAGAVGPITIDPLLAGSTWSAEPNQASAYFGSAVATLDADGDGFDDLAVGAPSYDDGESNEGAVFLYLGSPAGLSSVPASTLQGGQIDAGLGGVLASAGDVNGDGFDDLVVGMNQRRRAEVYLGSAAGLSAAPATVLTATTLDYGRTVASAGDVNGDGYDDVLVGAREEPNALPYSRDMGWVYLYFGSAAGISTVAAWTEYGYWHYAEFGWSMGPAGDVNGDGYGDVVFGSPEWDDGSESWPGAAYVYHGSPTGLGSLYAWSAYGATYRESYGRSVGSAGDVNGDGFDDVVVGSPGHDGAAADDGAAFVYLGSATGVSATPFATLEGSQASSGFGETVVPAGDVDGDGFDDVLVGAPSFDAGQVDEGAAFLWFGSPSGLRIAARLESDLAGTSLGWDLAAGDVDGSGTDEPIAGLRYYDGGETDEGAVVLFGDALVDGDGDGTPDLGDLCPTVPDTDQLDLDADGLGNACDDPWLSVVGAVTPGERATFVASGLAPGEIARFGGTVGAGGAGPCLPALGGLCLDLGAQAVVLGSAVADAAGEATLRVRAPAGLQPNGTYAAQATVVRGAGGAASVKSAVAVIDGTMLDWDGDGLTDASETAQATDPTDRDTDGDGLVDGADQPPGFDPLVADSDGDGVLDGADVCAVGDDALDYEGDGVPDACDVCPADSDPAQADADLDGYGDACDQLVRAGATVWTVEGNQVGAKLGGSVAAAGDVNGDGYDDVVVGADGYDGDLSGEGIALVYLGSATGLSTTAAWAREGNRADAHFGHAVASAGDVNGDGFDDVIVGAYEDEPRFSDQGSAYVFHGSAAGLSTVPAWTGRGAQAYAMYGSSVASAGDVNGDGFDDVVVGAPSFDAAYVYLGSAAGLSAAPVVTLAGGPDNDEFGLSVASAGDVNGDGFDDVVVGEYFGHGGAAHVFFGAPAGPASVADWVGAPGQASADFGYSVAGAGDVNGDGFDDVVVGARDYNDGQNGEGAAFLYFGSATGLPATPSSILQEDQAFADFGAVVAPAGDVDQDGYDDVLVSAIDFDGGQTNEGAVFLYLGSPYGLWAPAWTAERDQSEAAFGASVASAGDVDGDGRLEVVVGAPDFDNRDLSEGAAFLHTPR